MRSRGSAPSSAPGEQQCTLRIRNPAADVVYHLVFEGNIRKLTGAQLRLHLEAICLIPAEQQVLTFNGVPVENTSTGASLGLHNKAVLELHTAGEASRIPSSRRGEWGDRRRGGRQTHPAEEHLNQSDRIEVSHGLNTSATTASQCTPVPRTRQQRADRERAGERQRYPCDKHDCGGPRAATGTCAVAPLERTPSVQTLSPVDVIIEEDAIDGLGTAMIPFYDADVEDARLEQREYVWMMEQMRFETERMNRERELLRQREELEHEAEILERERCIVKRRTLQERRKLVELHQWVCEEMAMEAQILNLNGHENDYNNCANDDGDGGDFIERGK
ncbi:hypothetical protein TCDM_05485 [Trypanosoma cruzi Dm28c]|uniref:Ubiquitin-like domain-containing protein n=2 Tax=Trypanosoma cruzi TaxID=5693 RepID=V5DEZ6_TRYCR|nr:hypothetical protein TCDM_05485 [Trypanosoma cruzi Dm28c]PBJ79435.1 hypothetical protein BCY84_02940 [Trypanosoma cruzi cruzi]PWU99505.1 hypothetical protein C4B63_9g243 [Trypanosoma cruzi]